MEEVKEKQKTEKKRKKLFVPKPRFVFPKNTDEQIIKVKKKSGIKLDENYYNRLKRWTFNVGQFFFKMIYSLIAYPLVYLRYHMRVHGRKNLKEQKRQLKKGGFLTVSNHVFFWDFVALCASMKMGVPTVPAWGKLVDSKFTNLFSFAGVVPIPEDRSVFRKFYDFIGDVFKENKWVHIYPETGLWYYYVPIRPFKRGAAYFAYSYNKPVVPVGYSFRERKGLAKFFNRKDPFVDVHIGEPIYPDNTLPKKESIDLLNKQCRESIMKMVGISSEEENEKIIKEYYTYEDGHFYTTL